MTTYTTRTLAIEVIGDEGKAATRTLRKFLRDHIGGGAAVVGKGGRYSLDYTKPQLRKLIKDFAAWQVAQEDAKAARAAALQAKVNTIEVDDDAPATAIEPLEDEADTEVEGPTDEEIAEMLADDDEADIEA